MYDVTPLEIKRAESARELLLIENAAERLGIEEDLRPFILHGEEITVYETFKHEDKITKHIIARKIIVERKSGRTTQHHMFRVSEGPTCEGMLEEIGRIVASKIAGYPGKPVGSKMSMDFSCGYVLFHENPNIWYFERREDTSPFYTATSRNST